MCCVTDCTHNSDERALQRSQILRNRRHNVWQRHGHVDSDVTGTQQPIPDSVPERHVLRVYLRPASPHTHHRQHTRHSRLSENTATADITACISAGRQQEEHAQWQSGDDGTGRQEGQREEHHTCHDHDCAHLHGLSGSRTPRSGILSHRYSNLLSHTQSNLTHKESNLSHTESNLSHRESN